MTHFQQILLFTCLFTELFTFTYLYFSNSWTVEKGLPLHMCDFSVISCLLLLLLQKQIFFEFGFYWGLTGGIIALVTYPSYWKNKPLLLFNYYLCHITIIVVPLYYLYAYQFSISWNSYLRTMIITQTLIPPIFWINKKLKTNYMYLNRPTDFQHMFPSYSFPYNILFMEIITFFIFALMTLLVISMQNHFFN